MSDNNIEEKVNRRTRKKEKMSRKKFWTMVVLVYLAIIAIIVLFVMSGDKDDLFEAHWKENTKVITMGGVDYQKLSSADAKTYIGSTVSDKLNGVKDKKIASVRSYLLYVSVFFSLKNDPDFNYIVDGNGSIYVKKSIYDEAVKYTENFDNMNAYKMTSSKKDLKSMNEISLEEYEMLDELTGKEIIITDKLIAEDFETRREIYGFYDNGVLYKARMELFKYKGDIYKTTYFVDANKNKGTTTLKGIKLPEDQQERFLSIWE